MPVLYLRHAGIVRPAAPRMLGVVGEDFAAKNAQAPADPPGYHPRMHVARAPDDPLRIEIARPVALPGVTVARFASDGRLFRSVKDHVATVQNYTGHSEWWAHGRVWSTRPGALQLKSPGDVHRELRRDGPARFQILLYAGHLLDEARDALDLRPADHTSMSLDSDSPTGAPIARLHALLRTPGAAPLALQTALAEALRALVDLRTPRAPRRWGAPVRRARELIDARYSEPLTLDELAAHAGLDKFVCVL